jgi:23S rRNA (adenine2503-C2)-methyltransferase
LQQEKSSFQKKHFSPDSRNVRRSSEKEKKMKNEALFILLLWVLHSFGFKQWKYPTRRICLLRNHRDKFYSLSLPELGTEMRGTGKAKLIWSDLRSGVNPLSDEGLLSTRAKGILNDILRGNELLPEQVLKESVSSCGTRKMLLKLNDGLEIESVLIPKVNKTTLCISTQVGCDRGCIFCLSGKMGIVRNLTSSEIINQVIVGLQVVSRESLPKLDNIVLMGIGDAGRNLLAVGDALRTITDTSKFRFPTTRVTLSTVGPSPEIFSDILKLPCDLAWSLHSADDTVRKKLVPSTKHSTVALREGLIEGLKLRPTIRARTMMIALTLLDGINDRESDAELLVDFVKPILEIAPKININLLPYNDINVPGLFQPSYEKICQFQRIVHRKGLFCSVRAARGEYDFSACGMLATKSRRKDLKLKTDDGDNDNEMDFIE